MAPRPPVQALCDGRRAVVTDSGTMPTIPEGLGRPPGEVLATRPSRSGSQVSPAAFPWHRRHYDTLPDRNRARGRAGVVTAVSAWRR